MRSPAPRIASAGVSQQALDLDLVDEACVSPVPVLFGEGIPYCSTLRRGHLLLEDPTYDRLGHAHPVRPFVSRRDFLRRSAVVAGIAGAAPLLWQQPAYSADTPVGQVHLNFGGDAAREMTVSWMTPGPVRSPFAQMGERRAFAEAMQYDGYPGYFHHVRLDRLQPARGYGYRIGHDDKTRTSTYRFTTGPDRAEPFVFTAFGDQGTDTSFGQPPNQPSANTALAKSFSPALHLVVGDLAYANGDQKVWDDWFDMVTPMASSTPWMPCIGNHEIESQLDLAGTGESWGAHLAFHLTDSLGLQAVINGIDAYYLAWRETSWHPFRTLSGAIFFGWIVLAIGAYRSGALRLGRSVALGLMTMLALGTLKGTQIPQSIIAAGGLCAAFVPLGISLLRGGPPPSKRAVLWLTVLIGVLVLGAAFGPNG
ncbi:MAG: twin-arginine translocation signal domain-containing protein [Streptosporangiales bacterium]|nr:twin-arginine translocation signal domain-containing protein [Streptosporangiales bacterium]